MNRFYALGLTSLVVLAGCGKPTASEYFSRAEVEYKAARATADTLQNREAVTKLFEPAVESYSKVVQDYPNDPLAERALFMTAKIRNDDMRDPENAIVSFRQYADKYPEATQAPVATFMVGYLYHNELHQLDSASSWYKRFLDRYPQNEMAVSAQFELSSLGKSPDELLPPDTTSVDEGGMAAGSKTKKTGGRPHPM